MSMTAHCLLYPSQLIHTIASSLPTFCNYQISKTKDPHRKRAEEPAKRKAHIARELKANSKSLTFGDYLVRVEPGTTGCKFYGVAKPRFKGHTRPLRSTKPEPRLLNIFIATSPFLLCGRTTTQICQIR